MMRFFFDTLKIIWQFIHHFLVSGKVYSSGSNDFGQLGHEQARKRPRMSKFCMWKKSSYHIYFLSRTKKQKRNPFFINKFIRLQYFHALSWPIIKHFIRTKFISFALFMSFLSYIKINLEKNSKNLQSWVSSV